MYKSCKAPQDYWLLEGQRISWQLLLQLHLDQSAIVRDCLLRDEDLILSSKSKMKTTHATTVMKPNVQIALARKFGDTVTAMTKVMAMIHDFLTIFRHHVPLGSTVNDGRLQKIRDISDYFISWKNECQTDPKEAFTDQ